MDKLKNFIDTHKEAFKDDLLPEGHFERFEKKLPVRHKLSGRRWLGFGVAAVAAVVAFVVFLNIQSEMHNAPVHQTNTYSCETQKEIDELRVYYTMQMEEMYAQIRSLYKADQVPGGLELLQETKQVIKTTADFEEQVLPNLPCNETSLFAMTQHYNTSLQSLSIMLRQMECIINNDSNL